MAKLYILILASALTLCIGIMFLSSELIFFGDASFALALLLASAVAGFLLVDGDTLDFDFRSDRDSGVHKDAGIFD